MSETLGVGLLNLAVTTPQGEFDLSGTFNFTSKAKAPKKAANDVEFITFSVRLPDPFYRDVNIHIFERREQAQNFVPRAITGLLEREKDREVVFGAPKTKITGPVTMLSARIETSIYDAMKRHVIKHGEKVQGWNIRAFTEQMEIDDVLL